MVACKFLKHPVDRTDVEVHMPVQAAAHLARVSAGHESAGLVVKKTIDGNDMRLRLSHLGVLIDTA